jgi:hypothetical protein
MLLSFLQIKGYLLTIEFSLRIMTDNVDQSFQSGLKDRDALIKDQNLANLAENETTEPRPSPPHTPVDQIITPAITQIQHPSYPQDANPDQLKK